MLPANYFSSQGVRKTPLALARARINRVEYKHEYHFIEHESDPSYPSLYRLPHEIMVLLPQIRSLTLAEYRMRSNATTLPISSTINHLPLKTTYENYDNKQPQLSSIHILISPKIPYCQFTIQRNEQVQPGQPKLIFILGTAFSGSTLLGQILSNRPNATFVGELYDVNQGWRKAQCSCPQGLDCEFWNGVQFDETIYQQLLRRNKGLLVDASKYPHWILRHAEAMDESKVVVLFKHPENFLFGCYKRKQLRDWGGEVDARWTIDDRLALYVEWYRNALEALIPRRIHFLSYDALANSTTVSLQRLHHLLGTQYRDGEERFWEKTNNHILGSNGNVIQQIRQGQMQGCGAIERRDHRAFVSQEVPGWAERCEQATAVHHELLQRAATELP